MVPTRLMAWMVPNAPVRAGRRWLAVAVAGLVLLSMAPACGLRHHTVATRNGTLGVSPPTGPVGTSFSLTAGGFRPGEPLTFEVDIPGRAKFVGPSHTAGPDGMVTSTYKPQTGDPPGTYQLKAVGSQGTRAQASLVVQ